MGTKKKTYSFFTHLQKKNTVHAIITDLDKMIKIHPMPGKRFRQIWVEAEKQPRYSSVIAIFFFKKKKMFVCHQIYVPPLLQTYLPLFQFYRGEDVVLSKPNDGATIREGITSHQNQTYVDI